jgi:pimeloyl-ACP methyl ester carboxylesterase
MRGRRVVTAAGIAMAPAVAWQICHHTAPTATSWAAGWGEERQFGRLGARVDDAPAGDPAEAVLLLHGLLSSGDIYGQPFDHSTHGTRVVPDLLGFGRSMRHDLGQARLEDHLDALDERLSERSCVLMCDHRRLAQAAIVAASPHLPTAIARRTVEHTWPAYRDAVDLIQDNPWMEALELLTDAGCDITLARGGDDVVTAGGTYERLERSGHLRVVTEPGADHHLPLRQPETCVALLTGAESTS